MFHRTKTFLLFIGAVSAGNAIAQSDFRVPPYVQNPDFTSMSIIWFSESNQPGTVIVSDELGLVTLESNPVQANALAYPIWEINTHLDEFPGGVAPPAPYRHRVRFDGLQWDKQYNYTVVQGGEEFTSTFRTPPGILKSVRFAVYGDSETEPESDGEKVEWADPTGGAPNRRYLIDQTIGYANNLQILLEQDFDFIAIAGDLVQSGGEQRDWDRFWKHNTHLSADSSLGGRTPIFAVPGNHEYYASPHAGQGQLPKEYRQPFSEEAVARYRTYFETPSNGTGDDREGRYYRFNYGPVTMIAIDVCNNGLNQGPEDTNLQLLGEDDPSGGPAPSFAPGSPQYTWLEEQLADAQQVSPFTFVVMHYSPYSVGPHGWPAGDGPSEDPLSGVPVRGLTPLFHKYGVDAVFAGHDEMWERSVVEGTEVRPGGQERPHEIHFFDVGVGGDGLRGPVAGLENLFQRFLVHSDVPESWDGPQLLEGGKHYGHLEVSVDRTGPHTWEATLTPVYAFPLFNESGTQYLGFERRIYDDVVTLVTDDSPTILADENESPSGLALEVSAPYPNPTSGGTSIRFTLPTQTHVAITVYDVAGRLVRTVLSSTLPPGAHVVDWDGATDSGKPAPPGLHLIRIALETTVIGRTVSVVR
ncbi:MAG TPA: metallophosphoesterase [Rhodothermales bacterium]|nr:metallophosphoesterase [Rhodothermales bacterium]